MLVQLNLPLIVNFLGLRYLRSADNDGTDVISSKLDIPFLPPNEPFRWPALTTGGEDTSHAAAVASRDS